MQDIFSESSSKKIKIIRSARFWILIGLVIVGVLFFIMLPVGIDYGIERYLKNQGADQVNLQDVDFNPITGQMTLTNLSVTTGGRMVVKIPQATLDIVWTPFINKRFVLKRFAISDSELTVEEHEVGRWQIGGINLPDQQETSGPASWHFGLEQLTVRNSIIKFISSQLSSDLKIEQAKISKLSSWMPEQSAHLEFKGQINDSNLQLQAEVSLFAVDFVTAGQIKLKGLPLMPFARLLEPHLKTLEGRLEADLKFETRRAADSGIRHYQKGLLKLSQNRTLIADADFSNGDLAWNGVVRMDISTSEERLKISADGKLNGSKLSMTLKNANIQIQQDGFDWQGKIDYAQAPAANDLNLNGALKIQNTTVTGPEINLTEETLDWKGVFTFSNPNSDTGQKITSDGALSIGPLAVGLPQQKLGFEHAGLKWQGKFDYAQEKSDENINADGQMRLDAVKLKSPELDLAEEKLTWKGALQFSLAAEAQRQRIKAEGTLDGSHLFANLFTPKVKFEHKGLSWKGRFDSGETHNFKSLEGEADLILKDIEIQHPETNQSLLNAERVDLQAIKVQGLDEVKVSQVVFNGLALIAAPKAEKSPSAAAPLFRVQEVNFKDIRLSQQKDLAIDAINFKDLKALLHRNPEGKWSVIDRLHAIRNDAFSSSQTHRSPADQNAAPDTNAKEKSNEFGFHIRQAEITGDSKLRFKDESVSPVFDIDLSLLEAHLTDLDNRKPEKPAEVKLLVSDGGGARLSLDGTMQPFSEPLSLDLIGKIEALELPLLSPYVIQSTGYRFVRGEMQADIPLKIDQNQIAGRIDLTLYNPKVQRVEAKDPEKKQKGKIQLNMSLDSALKLLRNKENNAKLNIPISGDIHDPQFSVADAVNQVLAKTLQASAISYLKYMLGPYGIGISVAQLAMEQAFKIRLNPIRFAPGSDELDEAAIDYLQRVAAIMKEYTEVHVAVCGIATESDRVALSGSPSTEAGAQAAALKDDSGDKNKTLRQKEPASSTTTDATLLELAKSRTNRIESQLVKFHEIASNRIIDCNPEIDHRAEARPRADLEI